LAGVGLIDLKRRIKSVISTQKITKAMGLVATVKFKTARMNLERYKPYYEQLNESKNRLMTIEGTAELEYCRTNEGKKDMYIVITSDSGLCGSYNSSVFNSIYSEIKNKDEIQLIVVGQKGRNYFASQGYEIAANFNNKSVNPSFKEVSKIVGIGRERFLNGEIRSLNLVYTKFHNTARQTVEVVKLLPMESAVSDTEIYTLFEPSFKQIHNYVLPKYLDAATYFALSNSIAREYAIRMNSMDNATKNASEILAKLKTLYNRARQGSITQEITEIVSGAEALKD
jgi:F-type H+-transporting ATPase subunit gamma